MASTAEPHAPFSHEYPTFGLPPGSVRGFLSVLICSFFWIVLLYPGERDIHVPLAAYGAVGDVSRTTFTPVLGST